MIITIKRRIEAPKELREFIFYNINYRRKVWNDFVEESRKYEDLRDFDVYRFGSRYLNEVDHARVMPVRLWCVDITRAVTHDVRDSVYKCFDMGKRTHRCARLRFKSFDRYRGSFKVEARSQITTGNHVNSRLMIKDATHVTFRANRYHHIDITLKEGLFQDQYDEFYMLYKDKYSAFTNLDVKEVAFMHELGKFYILVIAYVDFIPTTEFKYKKAGIDLGIHNPVCIKDKDDVRTFRMSMRILNRIHYLERRARRLQGIMDKKYQINKKRGLNPYSRNYEKVRRKYRKTWKKIFDIRDNWKKKICKYIAITYKKVVVDTYEIPVNSGMQTCVRKLLHNYNRRHAMSYFMKYLPHACAKYGSKYIEAPSDTTRTCSICGHINPHLPLSVRNLTCEKCGAVIDRDENAAQNCYAYA